MERLRLLARAGEAVKHEATGGIFLGEPLGDHRHHDVVGDQVTPVHVLRGPHADGAAGHRDRPEHVAG